MSIVTFRLVPRFPDPLPEIGLPTTVPVTLAAAELLTPFKCSRKLGKTNSLVPLERCWNSPLEVQATETRPVGPANVVKLGLPVVFVLRWSVLPPPVRSPLGITPAPAATVQVKNALHWSTK